MKWDEKLVSVIILNYNGTASIPRALQSVFMQDYPRIEIILSDDCSADFPAEEVLRNAMERKTPNIERIQVIASKERTGTVGNLRRALKAMRGDYYVNFGSDDALYNSRVISTYISTFCLFGWEPLLVCGQLGMYNSNLSRLLRCAVLPEDKKILYAQDARKLFDALAYRCVIPTVATCYRRDFPELVDAYDPIYKFYEDYPTFLRMARKGITPVFVDTVMAKHASGGIANGQSKDVQTAKEFFQDRNRMWQTELEPYRDLLSKDSKRKHRARRKMERRVYRAVRLRARGKPARVLAAASRGVSACFKRLKAAYAGNVAHMTLLKLSFLLCELRVLLRYAGMTCAPVFAALDGAGIACLWLSAALLVSKSARSLLRLLMERMRMRAATNKTVSQTAERVVALQGAKKDG